MKDRKAITNEIEYLLRKHCDACELRKKYHANEMKGNTTKLSTYCNKKCTVGKELQARGRELVNA